MTNIAIVSICNA